MPAQGNAPPPPSDRAAETRRDGPEHAPTLEEELSLHNPASHSEAGSIWRLKHSAEVLIGEEVARARGWAVCVVLLPTATLCFLPWLDGPPWLKTLYAVSAAIYVLIGLWILRTVRNEEDYTPRLFRLWGYISVVMTVPILYCLGTFSPTPLIVTLGLSFFGQGLDRRHAVLIPATAVTLYCLLALTILTGFLPDHGMLSSRSTSRPVLLFFTVMVPLVLSLGTWFSRVSHRSIRQAMERATAAQRLAGAREAQMLEAQRDLENLIHAGAGLGGRYTGARAGSYTLGAVIGRGAMGEVYAGVDNNTDEEVAVKLVRADIDYEPATYQRFWREGKIVENLNAANIVKIVLLGQMADGAPFIAMERLYGTDLSTLLRREQSLDLATTLNLVTEIARGLDTAHEAGVIHRDLKPQNLFLHQPGSAEEKTWKVLDFGVSKITDSSGTLTQGAVVGTPAYMAPEQAGSEQLDHRCDIYSLAAVMYRALTGRTPFAGAVHASLLFRLIYMMPPDPCQLNQELSVDVARVLALGLAKKPGFRFSSAGQMAKALEQAIASQLDPAWRRKADEQLARNRWGERATETVLGIPA